MDAHGAATAGLSSSSSWQNLTERTGHDLRAATPALPAVIVARPARELPRSRPAAGAAGRAQARCQQVAGALLRVARPALPLAWESAAGSAAVWARTCLCHLRAT